MEIQKENYLSYRKGLCYYIIKKYNENRCYRLFIGLVIIVYL